MIIEKKQTDKERFSFKWLYFDSAKEGLRRILQSRELKGRGILAPAYIGYSTTEKTSIFDPVREAGIRYLFYNLDSSLHIDKEGLKAKIRGNEGDILLLIHYFGFFDKGLVAIKE